jgi:hypothetical protein
MVELLHSGSGALDLAFQGWISLKQALNHCWIHQDQIVPSADNNNNSMQK